MAVAVIVPSFGRKLHLQDMLLGLEGQLCPGDKVIVVTCRDEDRPDLTFPQLILLSSEKGSSRQRNAALDWIHSSKELFSAIVFLDDDVVLAVEFLRNMERNHRDYPTVAGFTCCVIRDGAREGEILQETALHVAAQWEAPASSGFVQALAPYVGFSIGGEKAAAIRFDERLAEYGFMEDWDFFARMRTLGPTGFACDCGLVHLAAGAGRTNHRKLGFSQVINPIYLARKGTLPVSDCFRHLVKVMGANSIRIFSPGRGNRLIGNFLAIGQCLFVGVHPESVVNI